MSTAQRAPRCADAAEQRGDPLPGTAVPVARWLLVEQPGPWGRDALTQSRLDSEVARELAARAAAAGVRVQLIRRHGRAAHHAQGRRHWALVDSRPGRERVRWGRFRHDADLRDVDLSDVVLSDVDASNVDARDVAGNGAERTTTAGGDDSGPVYLVCTHGRHDTCCAVRGRAVVATLDRLAPGRVWESSHVGGCRFAANVVVLPHGLYYGGTGPADVEALVEATDSGHLVPHLLRGRSSLPPEVQAAEHHARERLGGAATRLDALRTVRTRRHDDGCARVELAPDDGSGTVLLVTVRRHDAGPPALLTCAATRAAPPQEWQLVDLRRA